MSLSRWSLSLVSIIGLLAVTVAGATIWLVFTDPVKTANVTSEAVATGNPGPILQAIGAVILGALKGLFRYL